MSATQFWQLIGVCLLAGMLLGWLVCPLLRALGAWLARRLPSRRLRAYPVRRRHRAREAT